MKQLIRQVLPGWAMRRIHHLFWDPARNLLWRGMNLTCELRSGLTVRVRSPADWAIYTEVLVNGEYDAAISRAIERSSGEMQVLDLGANVGYFVFRCADMFLRSFDEKGLSIVAIEGSHRTAADLHRRVESEIRLRHHVRVVHGLAGERSGSAYISDSTASHYGNSLRRDAQDGAVKTSYVDLGTLVDPDRDIDLLKCDIEGSEFSFIRNYKPLLSRVRTAVFEFHKYGEDLEDYRALLRVCGLQRSSVLRETPLFSIEVFERGTEAL